MLDGREPARPRISHHEKETEIILIGLESELQTFHSNFVGEG